MRTLYTGIALIIASTASAQLINGSFEMNGSPSLMGWEWTCDPPGQPNTAAPGAGEWCATKSAGHLQGCFPNYLYQRLPGAMDGTMTTVSGWVRCDDDVVCLGAYLGLGRINNGVLALEEYAGTLDFEWTYVSITDTIELGPGDTALVALNSGSIGGPIAPTPGYFDDIALEIHTGLEQGVGPGTQLLRLSPDGRHIAVNAMANERILLYDAQGRLLEQSSGSGSGWRMLSLPVGVHWLMVTVEGGHQRRSQCIVLSP